MEDKSQTKPNDEGAEDDEAAKETEPEAVEDEEQYQLSSTLHELKFTCSICGKVAPAQSLIGGIGPYQFNWVRPPIGWWLLTPAIVEADQPCIGLHVRCNACLRAGPMPERRGGRRRPRRRKGTRR